MLNTIQIIFDIIVSVLTVFGILWALISKVWGFSELLKRFGTVSSRQLSILADGDSYNSLSQDIVDTKIIRKKNILQIDKEHLGKVQESKLLLIHYDYIRDNHLDFGEILRSKSSKCAAIVYVPSTSPLMPPEDRALLNTNPYVFLVNFRGRLVNDVLTAMMTTPR